MPQGQKAGVRHNPAKGCGTALFPYLSYSAGFVFYSSDSTVPIQGNRGGQERPAGEKPDEMAASDPVFRGSVRNSYFLGNP